MNGYAHSEISLALPDVCCEHFQSTFDLILLAKILRKKYRKVQLYMNFCRVTLCLM